MVPRRHASVTCHDVDGRGAGETVTAEERVTGLARRFRRACDDARVPEEHRSSLWRRVERAGTGGGGEERLRSVMADYDHWRLFVSGREGDDTAALGFRRYWLKALQAFAGPRCTPEDVDEIAGHFFERVYRAVGTDFRWECSFRAYLKSVLVNAWRDHAGRTGRRRARELSLPGDEDAGLDAFASDDPSPERSAEARERSQAVRCLLSELAPADRHLLVACLVDGATGDELAESLGIARDAVYQRLHRAKKRFASLARERGLA